MSLSDSVSVSATSSEKNSVSSRPIMSAATHPGPPIILAATPFADESLFAPGVDETTLTVQLDSAPEAAVIVEAVRGTLTGNRESLERLFETTVSGNAERWSLDLVPKDLRLRGQVASVRVAGRGPTVREVQVLLADGDRSTMTIEPLPGGAP